MQTLFLRLRGLTAMPLIDTREELTYAQDLFRVNGNIRSLSRCTPRWFCHGAVPPTTFNCAEDGDRKVGLRCIMMLALGRQCLFPFSPVRVIASVNASALCGSMGTNRQRVEVIPWMPLGLRNTCVSEMKRTKEGGGQVALRDIYRGSDRGSALTCIYNSRFRCTLSDGMVYTLYHKWLNQQ